MTLLLVILSIIAAMLITTAGTYALIFCLGLAAYAVLDILGVFEH